MRERLFNLNVFEVVKSCRLGKRRSVEHSSELSLSGSEEEDNASHLSKLQKRVEPKASAASESDSKDVNANSRARNSQNERKKKKLKR